MASHCPHHHQRHCQHTGHSPTTATSACCCSFCHHLSVSPPLLSVDQLLQSLVSLLQQQQQQHPSLCPYSPHPSQPHTHHPNHHQDQNFRSQNLPFPHKNDSHQTQFVISSLLRRISTLESSLSHLSPSSTTNNHYHPSYSLRDTAARVIQTHFRSFLVRRSRTLRQLKGLASIKSRFASLKSSVSGKTHFNFEVVSRKTMDLLLKLDSIEDGDPMIRDGKRTIGGDLVRFIEFIEGIAVKRHGVLYKSAKNARFFVDSSNKSRVLNANTVNGDLSARQRQMVDKLRDRVNRISGFSRIYENGGENMEYEGFQHAIEEEEDEEECFELPADGRKKVSNTRNGVLVNRIVGKPRVKKTVSFAENGNVYRFFDDANDSILDGEGSFTDGSDSSDGHGECTQNYSAQKRKGNSEHTENEEADLDNGESGERSDDEGKHRRNRRIGGYHQDQDGSSVFSAPMPVKMESRADLMKKRTAVEIVT